MKKNYIKGNILYNEMILQEKDYTKKNYIEEIILYEEKTTKRRDYIGKNYTKKDYIERRI